MPIHISDETRQAAAGYDARTWANAPIIPPAKKREFEALAEEEEAKEKELGINQIPSNVAMRRYAKETTMDGYADGGIAKTLQTLEDQLSGRDAVRKGLEDLEDRMAAHREQDRRTDDDHARQLAGLREDVADLRRRGVSSADIKGMMSKMVGDLLAALDEKEEERREPTEDESANKSLMYAAVPYLNPNSTKADATKVVLWLVKSFGRKGGQAIPYDRERASQLLMQKAITPQEHQNWKEYGRLPDDVTPGRAQAAADRAMLTAHAMASLGIAPLAAAHMLRRR
jgi:hypothetical protein